MIFGTQEVAFGIHSSPGLSDCTVNRSGYCNSVTSQRLQGKRQKNTRLVQFGSQLCTIS